MYTEGCTECTERLKGRLHKHCRVCTEGCIECLMKVRVYTEVHRVYNEGCTEDSTECILRVVLRIVQSVY